jgi:hypothetical protein
MPKVLNKYRDQIPPGAVYIGRPSIWGNPFAIDSNNTREAVILKYHQYILNKPELITKARQELRGRDLVCFCKPQACHGDILLEIANS